MRGWLVAAVAVLFVGAALADDAKQEGPRVLTLGAWSAQADEIQKADCTTLSRVSQLRAAAEHVVVELRGKILDIAPRGDTWCAVSICGLFDGRAIREFNVPVADASGWERWDRIAWHAAPVILDDGKWTLRDQVSGGTGLSRTANPGVEVPPIEQPRKPAQFVEWLTKYARAAWYEDRDLMESLWKKAEGLNWVYPACVSAIDGDVVTVRFSADAYVDCTMQTNLPGAAPTWGVQVVEHGTKTVRRWGVAPDQDLRVRVPDPQLVPLISPGVSVDVLLRVRPGEHLTSKDGGFAGGSVAVWRLTPRKR